MENINLPSVINQSLAKFSRNRIGSCPRVFVTVSPDVPEVPWWDGSVKEFARLFLYESLLTSDPDAALEVAVRRTIDLNGLNAFVGVHPSYWVQLRVCGRGLRIMENLVDELFAEVGYRCEEWVGVEDSNTRLGIFGAAENPEAKLVFCLELRRDILKCDLLIPVCEALPLRSLAPDPRQAPLELNR
jgi:hypothetical protein